LWSESSRRLRRASPHLGANVGPIVTAIEQAKMEPTSTVGNEFFVLHGHTFESGAIVDPDGVSSFGGDNSGMRMIAYSTGVSRRAF